MEAELADLFYTDVKAFALSEGLPVSYPNKDYNDKNVAEYLRLLILPTQPDVRTVCGGISQYLWMMQISVYVRKDTGDFDAKQMADKIKPAFPVTYKFIGVNYNYTVISPPTPVPPISVGAWYSIPVQFRTQAVY